LPKLPLPDLFASTLDTIVPVDGNGPRLWVRRVIIWSERGQMVRDVPLRPGLNIVWSPDADGAGNPMGHGGGKTSFCRLLRYCLGEDSFGTTDQRHLIANAMPEAHVGAEVILDGELWTVVRPIGNPRGRHFVQKGGTLESAFVEDMPNTGISPLRQAIAAAIMAEATPHIPVGSNADEAWEAALAWISRDQECRLLDILEWRAPETQSRSPSRNMSKAQRLSVVRLLINALQPEEIDANRLAQSHRRAAEDASRRKERIDWVRDEIGRGLHAAFGGNPEDAGSPTFWQDKATAAASVEAANADPEIDEKLKVARDGVEEKRASIIEAEKRLAGIDGELAGIDGQLRIFSEQLPKADLRVHDATNPRCDSCGQVIPPSAQAFIAQQRAMRDELASQQTRAIASQKTLKAESKSLKYQVAVDSQELVRRQASLATMEVSAKAAAERLASAKGYVTMTTQYQTYGTEIARVDALLKAEQAKEAKARREAQDCRRAAQLIVNQLSSHFDAVIRFLIPDDATGAVVLTNDGIDARISLHGNLTTAAVDSLKVVAFDLAALILTVEGKTQLPGFWLHDSPREADLGLHLYHRLFEFALWLEKRSETPAFQYVLTTTTEPPAALQSKPWEAMRLHSSPADQRLFRRNL
jgi:hypothetical protein